MNGYTDYEMMTRDEIQAAVEHGHDITAYNLTVEFAAGPRKVERKALLRTIKGHKESMRRAITRLQVWHT